MSKIRTALIATAAAGAVLTGAGASASAEPGPNVRRPSATVATRPKVTPKVAPKVRQLPKAVATRRTLMPKVVYVGTVEDARGRPHRSCVALVWPSESRLACPDGFTERS